MFFVKGDMLANLLRRNAVGAWSGTQLSVLFRPCCPADDSHFFNFLRLGRVVVAGTRTFLPALFRPLFFADSEYISWYFHAGDLARVAF